MENKKILPFLCMLSLFVVGCNSVSTHNYETSLTVERSAISEADCANELNGKSLLIAVTEEKEKTTLSFKRIGSSNVQYCHAELDSQSFVALLIAPGEYILQNSKKIKTDENKVVFFSVKKDDITEISSAFYKHKYPGKYLSKEIISSDPSILSANNYFASKVSFAEKFGHNTGKVLASPLYLMYGIVYGIHYAGFAGMCCFFAPPICVCGAVLWGTTYFLIPEDHRMTLSKIGGGKSDTSDSIKNNGHVDVDVKVTVNNSTVTTNTQTQTAH